MVFLFRAIDKRKPASFRLGVNIGSQATTLQMHLMFCDGNVPSFCKQALNYKRFFVRNKSTIHV